MLSTLGSIASQNGIIRYQNLTMIKKAFSSFGGYGQVEVYNWPTLDDGNADDDPSVTLTNLTSDGINFYVTFPTIIGRGSGDANGGWGEIYYDLKFTNGTICELINVATPLFAGGVLRDIIHGGTGFVPLDGKIPYSIRNRISAAAYSETITRSDMFEVLLTR